MTPVAAACRSRRAALMALAAATVAVAAGCALSRPAPVKQTYLVEPPPPPRAARAHPLVLRLGTVNVAAPFRGRPFVYRASTEGYEVDYYSEFLVAPAAMISEATARALDRAGVFARVIPPGAHPDGDYVLDGFVTALYGDRRDPGPPRVELAVTYFLTRNDGASTVPLWSRDYGRRLAVAESTPDGYVRAFSAGLGEVLGELARDLAALPLDTPVSGAGRPAPP